MVYALLYRLLRQLAPWHGDNTTDTSLRHAVRQGNDRLHDFSNTKSNYGLLYSKPYAAVIYNIISPSNLQEL
jgi:hypothetical protein